MIFTGWAQRKEPPLPCVMTRASVRKIPLAGVCPQGEWAGLAEAGRQPSEGLAPSGDEHPAATAVWWRCC